MPNIPSVVKYLHDAYPIKFILTGPVLTTWKNYFTESLARRKVVFEMFPLSFAEFLISKASPIGHAPELHGQTLRCLRIRALEGFYEEYLLYGGLPDVALAPAPARSASLQDILSSYINIDVRAPADFQKIAELPVASACWRRRIGNRLDNVKLATIIGFSRPTLLQYLEFLEKTPHHPPLAGPYRQPRPGYRPQQEGVLLRQRPGQRPGAGW
ncbi:MAG: ATP-binding protein [Dehalococcoidia bacterium]|nr:ATP-binding protein [Dehalococcoidia bacterium]